MNKKSVDVLTIISPEIKKLKKLGIETPNLDCRILLSQILSKGSMVYNHENISISKNQINEFQALIRERSKGKPVSRIINKRDFWKGAFSLNEDTLDPRPDSEVLITSILGQYQDKSQRLKILDLGSGSGCLGLSLAEEYQNSNITFLDVSEKSLEIVKNNAYKLQSKRKLNYIALDWHEQDWNKKLLKNEKKKFDVIVSNPPYIPSKQIKFLQKEVKDYDPIMALDGGCDGLKAYRAIIPKLKFLLKTNGKLFFEIGKGQEDAVSEIASDNGLICINYNKDLSGIIRVLTFIIK